MNRRSIIQALFACIAMAAIASGPAANAAAATKPAKPAHIARGQNVKLTDHLVPGKTVVFDFYSDFCGPCVQIAPALEKLHQTKPDVVVVKVDINRPGIKGIDWDSPVVRQYNVRAVPHFKVYGPDGKLKAEDSPTSDRARQMVLAMLN
jgi:thiol-disulfide isomerase/thioredoxin